MAVDMFLKIDGVKGEAKDDKHKDEIDVLAWSWGGSMAGSAGSGGGGGTGKVDLQDLSITKYTDKSSSELWKYLSTGKHFKEATLTVRKAGDKPLEYYSIKISDFIVTTVHCGMSGGEIRGTETVTFNFSKVEVKYTEQNADGSGGTSSDYKYDVKANKLF